MITISRFGGEAPLYSSDTLPLPYASYAKDCMFDAGSLRGFGAEVDTGLSISLATASDAAIYKPDAARYLMQFPQRTDFIWNAHAGDSRKRAYWFSDAHAPRYGDNAAIVGAGVMPRNYYLLGMPAPTVAPAITITTATDSGGKPVDHAALGHDSIYRSYTYTYVNDFGEESGPFLNSDGSALAQHVMFEGDKVTVSNLVPLSGNYPLSAGKIRVYQSNLSGNFVRMAEIPLAQGSVQFVNTAASGAQLATGLTMPPVSTMKGACLTSYGFMVGFAGNTLYCSDQYLYHSWPTTYAKPCKFEILRVFPSPQGAYVLTTGGPFILMGTDPSNTQLVDVVTDDVCLSAKGCCDIGGAVVYVSQNGLSLLTESGVEPLTASIFNHLAWAKLKPETLRLVRHSRQVVCFGQDDTYIYSSGVQDDSMWVRSSIRSDVAFTDIDTGAMLFGRRSSGLKQFDSNPNDETSYEWHSPRIDLPSPQPYSCFRLHADDFTDLALRVLVDDRVVQDWLQIPVDEAVDRFVYGRLPPYKMGRGVQLQFKGSSILHSFLLASSFADMRGE